MTVLPETFDNLSFDALVRKEIHAAFFGGRLLMAWAA